jgi:hypothetical protein
MRDGKFTAKLLMSPREDGQSFAAEKRFKRCHEASCADSASVYFHCFDAVSASSAAVSAATPAASSRSQAAQNGSQPPTILA